MRGGHGACSCVVVFFTRPGKRMETGGSLLPRVGLEKRNKNRVLIKGKSQSSNSHLIFCLFFFESQEDLWIL